MTVRQPRYPLEEFARRGDEIYDRDIRANVESQHDGEIVAIDIETGAWELDVDEDAAADRLEARLPDAQIWVLRVGSRYVRRFGAGQESSQLMMTGTVTAQREAILQLILVDANDREYGCETVIDTGYTGTLTLPPSTIAQLGLRWHRVGRAVLADGSEHKFNVYKGSVL